MRLAALLLLPLAIVPAWGQMAPDRRYLRFERAVTLDEGLGPAACALLPAEVFAHAAPSLADLRLYAGPVEVPYVTTLSQASGPETQTARVLNARVIGGRLSFDLEMPPRPYTQVTLDLAAKDFVALAKVKGRDDLGSGKTKPLGEFTLFDLTGERLGRGTTLDLEESSFRYLHIDLTMKAATAETIRGADVPPSREAQTLYAEVASVAPEGQAAVFHVPARVPVERVSFELQPGFKGSFDRWVRISAHADGAAAGLDEELTGEILRVNLKRDGHAIDVARQSVPATLGVNMHGGATVTVTVDNDGHPPVPLVKVRLEMRERKVCFDTPASAPVLLYGDPALRAPVYDYARRFATAATVREARFAAEEPNPAYEPRPSWRTARERYPDLLWVVLLLVLGLLAVTVLRLTRHRRG